MIASTTFSSELSVKLQSASPDCITQRQYKILHESCISTQIDYTIICLIGVNLLAQNDASAVKWARCMTLENISQMSDVSLVSLPA